MESADQLKLEIEDRQRRLAEFNLAESTARRLDAELARAGSEAAQLAVLDRWIAPMECAVAFTETIVHGRDADAERRAMRPREPERRLTVDPPIQRVGWQPLRRPNDAVELAAYLADHYGRCRTAQCRFLAQGWLGGACPCGCQPAPPTGSSSGSFSDVQLARMSP